MRVRVCVRCGVGSPPCPVRERPTHGPLRQLRARRERALHASPSLLAGLCQSQLGAAGPPLGVGVYLELRDPSAGGSGNKLTGVSRMAVCFGPIYALAYAPNGASLASGGHFETGCGSGRPATGKSPREFMDQVCRTSALAVFSGQQDPGHRGGSRRR